MDHQIGIFRSYLLRAGYALIAVGLVLMILPGIITVRPDLPLMNSVVRSMLGALSLLAFLGIRYPVKMLPVMFFELVWKSIWLLAFWTRMWSTDTADRDTLDTFTNCVFGIIVVLVVVPWLYVFREYVRSPSDRWKLRDNPLD